MIGIFCSLNLLHFILYMHSDIRCDCVEAMMQYWATNIVCSFWFTLRSSPVSITKRTHSFCARVLLHHHANVEIVDTTKNLQLKICVACMNIGFESYKCRSENKTTHKERFNKQQQINQFKPIEFYTRKCESVSTFWMIHYYWPKITLITLDVMYRIQLLRIQCNLY